MASNLHKLSARRCQSWPAQRWQPNPARPGSAKPGALLLEVVLALTIMVAAMGVLGAQLVGGLRMTGQAERTTRATELADRLLALVEMDPQMQEMILIEEQADGEFGDQYPGWFWQIYFEPTEVGELGVVHLEVLYQEDPDRQDSVDGARLMRTVSLLKTAPARIDLAADFGMDEQQLLELQSLLPIAEFDPSAVNPQELIAMLTQDPEMLMQFMEYIPALLPLLQGFGGQGGEGGAFAGLNELGGFGGEGGFDPQELQELMQLGEELGLGEIDPGAFSELGTGAPAGGAQPGGRPGGAAATAGGGRPGRAGIAGGQGRPGRGGLQPGGPQPGAQQPAAGEGQYTIEDLIRMRDQQRQGGGR